METRKKKQSVWLYAAILFISAFFVLLFTAYSQIKLNKNLENYKSQVFNTESEKELIQKHFVSAQEMNRELNAEIDALKDEISLLKNKISDLESKNRGMESDQIKKSNVSRVFSEALILYTEGNEAGCYDLLDTIDAKDLADGSGKAYEALKRKAAAEAGKKLLDEGYELYKKAKYEDAITLLERSYVYASDEEFSDMCLYYIAYSELNSGSRTAAVEKMKQLVEKFPESEYITKAKKFIARYDRQQ
jgi:TolA-binding protein